MIELEDRLRDLGERLALPTEAGIDVDALFDAASSTTPDRRGPGVLLRVAAVLLALAVAVAIAVPSSRRTVADWFGLDGVELERDPRVDPPERPDPFGTTPGTVFDVGGTAVLYSEFDGSLAPDGLRKSLGDGTDVVEVGVRGAPGVWVDGAPHEVSYRDADGTLVFERFAGNTLLWQRGDRVARLEGFADVDAAVAFAIELMR